DADTRRITAQVHVAWDRVPELRLDPSEIPDETLVKALTTDRAQGISLLGPGAPEHITLDAWRTTKRLQELEFVLARTLTRRYADDPACTVPAQVLFPQMLGILHRFVEARVAPGGRRNRQDVFREP